MASITGAFWGSHAATKSCVGNVAAGSKAGSELLAWMQGLLLWDTQEKQMSGWQQLSIIQEV